MKKFYFTLPIFVFQITAFPGKVIAFPGEGGTSPLTSSHFNHSQKISDTTENFFKEPLIDAPESTKALYNRILEAQPSTIQEKYVSQLDAFQKHSSTWMDLFKNLETQVASYGFWLKRVIDQGVDSLTEDDLKKFQDIFSDTSLIGKTAKETSLEKIKVIYKNIKKTLTERNQAKAEMRKLLSEKAEAQDKKKLIAEGETYLSYSISTDQFLEAHYTSHPLLLNFRLANFKFSLVTKQQELTNKMTNYTQTINKLEENLKKRKKEEKKKEEKKKEKLGNTIQAYQDLIEKFFPSKKNKNIQTLFQGLATKNVNTQEVFAAAVASIRQEITDCEKKYRDSLAASTKKRLVFFEKEHAYYERYIPEDSNHLITLHQSFKAFLEKIQISGITSEDLGVQIQSTAQEMDVTIPEGLINLQGAISEDIKQKKAEAYFPPLTEALQGLKVPCAPFTANDLPTEVHNVIGAIEAKQKELENQAPTQENLDKQESLDMLLTQARDLEAQDAMQALEDALVDSEPDGSSMFRKGVSPEETFEDDREILGIDGDWGETSQNRRVSKFSPEEIKKNKETSQQRSHNKQSKQKAITNIKSGLSPHRLPKDKKDTSGKDTQDMGIIPSDLTLWQEGLEIHQSDAQRPLVAPQAKLALQKITKAFQTQMSTLKHDAQKLEQAKENLNNILKNRLLENYHEAIAQFDKDYERSLTTYTQRADHFIKFSQGTLQKLTDLIQKNLIDETIQQEFEKKKLYIEDKLLNLKFEKEEREKSNLMSCLSVLTDLGFYIESPAEEKFLTKLHLKSVEEAAIYINSLGIEETTSLPPIEFPEGGFVEILQRKQQKEGKPALLHYQIKALQIYDNLIINALEKWEKFLSENKDYYAASTIPEKSTQSILIVVK